ncbi:MAG: hypothetical protein KatS3mg110_1987 [Pirellulaceae bacterium]|nr:MAG: hypothetical protein KatS3mg110_1987 [Pirellulaceae bacterium]
MSVDLQTVFGITVLVAIWLGPILLAAWIFSRKGYSPHWTWFGVVPLVGMVVLCTALLLPYRGSVAHVPQKSDRTLPPWLRPWIVALLSSLVFAFLGHSLFVDSPFSLKAPTPYAVAGGCIGLLLGLAVYLDDWAVRRRIEKRNRSAASEPAPHAPAAFVTKRHSNAMAILMLFLPLAAGILIWQHQRIHLTGRGAILLIGLTVVSTAVLGYLDLRQLMVRSGSASLPPTQILSPPVDSFTSILLVWFVAYPLHFFTRRRLGASNLVLPALVTTAVFIGAILSTWLSKPDLPSVQSPEVLRLIMESIERGPMYQALKDVVGKVEIRDPVEISFDPVKQRRVARARLISKEGETDFYYTIEWIDRKKGRYAIRFYLEQP